MPMYLGVSKFRLVGHTWEYDSCNTVRLPTDDFVLVLGERFRAKITAQSFSVWYPQESTRIVPGIENIILDRNTLLLVRIHRLKRKSVAWRRVVRLRS